GKRISAKEYQLAPAARPSVEADGRGVFPATMIRDLRCVVHELDGERLLTILNYSPNAGIVRVALPTPRAVSKLGAGALSKNGEKVLSGSFLAELPADGYALYRLGSAPSEEGTAIPQEPLEAEVEKQLRALRERDPFAALRDGSGAFKLKRHFSARYHMLELDNGKIAVLLDQSRGGNVRGVEAKGVKQLFTGKCHLGKLYFVNAAQFNDFSNFVLDGTERKDGKLSAVFRATVTEDAADRHDLAGLEIVKRVSLDADNTITVEFTFRNTSRRDATPDFRVHNILCAGDSYLYVNGKKLTNAKAPSFSLYTRDARELPFLVGRVKPIKWNGKAVRLDARRGGVKYRWLVDAPDYPGVFINNNRFFTVEPLSGRFTLKPGESRTFRLTAKVELP
ncbi:MAG: hypothetical protein IJJ28_05885, partial [Lentisphaeria bacterium]|nr:hypothetical protein [Lentisphaeria bacterium]